MWKYQQPGEVIFGKGALKNLQAILEEKGYKKPLLLTDEVLLKIGVVDKVKEDSGVDFVGVMSDIEPNPTVHNVTAGINMALETKADVIIAVGGGSVIDCGKAVRVAAFAGWTFEELFATNDFPGALPMIAVPTTAGTGAEVTPVALISWHEKNMKHMLKSPILFPTIALVDPSLTYSAPKSVTAISGIDVLAHALDSLGNVNATPVTASLAVSAAKLAFANLLDAWKDGTNLEARDNMAQASTIAGLAFSQTSTSGAHACSYSLTAKFNVPHGEACAFTLDSWVKANAKVAPQMDVYAKEIGFNNANEMADALSQLKKDLGLRTTLSEIGVSVDDLDYLAEQAMGAGNMMNSLAQIGHEGIKEIYLSKQ